MPDGTTAELPGTTDDEIGPTPKGLSANWTIKQIPVETRLRAIEAAKRADEPVHAWITRAVELLATQETRNLVIPPGQPRPTEVGFRANQTDATEQLARLLEAAAAFAASPIAKQVKGAANQALRQRFKALVDRL